VPSTATTKNLRSRHLKPRSASFYGLRSTALDIATATWIIDLLGREDDAYRARRGLRGAWHRPDWDVPTGRSLIPSSRRRQVHGHSGS